MIIKRTGIEIELTEEEKNLFRNAIECLEDIVYTIEDEKTENPEEKDLATISAVEYYADYACNCLKYFLQTMNVDYE